MWKTKGMNQDLSVSAFNPEFAYENMNLRLSTNEGNTLMSWVNERGTAPIRLTNSGRPYTLVGTPVGTAVLNHQLVVFTHGTGNKPDYIYKLTGTEGSMDVDLLYNGNLNFKTNYPLETMVAFEADHIQKVYWTDGENQPRLINIAATSEKRAKWTDTSFDFVPTFSGGKIEVTKTTSGGGLFAPGVIQYCFTYINKYGQQSNIVDVSPLFYLSYGDRGASPEDKVTSSFKITISEGDAHFDYIRLYSIQRTSLDATPIIKFLDDIPIQASSTATTTVVSYEDNVPLTLTYTKGEYLTKTLPVEKTNTSSKILSVSATDGTFNATVTPKSGSAIYSNDSEIKFVAIVNDGAEIRDIISLQDAVVALANGQLYQGSDTNYHIQDYCFYFDIDQDFNQEMQTRAENTGNFHDITWDLSVGGVRQHLDYQTDILMYSFASQNWYIVTSFNAMTVTTRKTITTEVTETVGGSVYTDNGTSGSTVDPYELLYVGGKEISALTMMDKDATLFLANCTQKNVLVTDIQAKFDDLRINGNNGSGTDDGSNRPVFYRDGAIKQIVQDATTGIYSNTHTLKWDNRKITTFKGGDKYRFGFQLQKQTGEWLEPIFMNDVTNYYYPQTSRAGNVCTINMAYAKSNIDLARFGLDYSLYKNIRPVMVYPTVADREVLCQGVLNPTVFNAQDRIEKYPFAQASWYFRPYTGKDEGSGGTIENICSVTTEVPLTENPDLTVEPAYFQDKTIQAYVAIVEATVNDDYYLDFIRGGKVTMTKHQYERDDYGNIQEDYWNAESQDFWGAIILEGGTYHPNCKRIVLLSSFPFDPQVDSNLHVDSDGYERDYSYVYDNCNYMATSGHASFPIYSDMKFYNGTMLYYQNPTEDEALNNYKFKFYACNWYITHDDTYYVIQFTHKANNNPASFESLDGSTVRFAHYSHVYSRTDVGNDKNWDALRRKIEIQNAENLYDTPFSDYDKKKISTNGEYFIDQSIITLNSPDIDFDTTVQVYGNEDLKLRVIGAIPITAEVSAHDIVAGSAKLELEHNVEAHSTQIFGIGELRKNVYHENSADTSKYGSQRLVAEYIWNDAVIANNAEADDHIKTLNFTQDFLIHPWHRSGSLNNDWRKDEEASSLLKTKKESNALYSMYTEYLQPTVNSGIVPSCTPNTNIKKFENIGSQIHLQENDYIINYRLKSQNSGATEINYYPNIDKALYNTEPYQIYPFTTGEATKVSSPVLMKYKSGSHAVIALNASAGGNIPILPYASRGGGVTVGQYTNDTDRSEADHDPHTAGTTFWGDINMMFTQDSIASSALPAINYDFLWIGELYKNIDNPYGGTSDAAVRANKWQIAGGAVPLNNGKATIIWSEGDTYYQRYDCLKTYPYTEQDPNQLVEILSFMCETHVNIDGRYDKNRGQVDNTTMSPVNFNKINDVYSQQDNYFTARKLDTEDVKGLRYPNQMTYSKTKTSGADVDLWTNVTLASTLELDGDKGEISSLQKFNNQLIAFQNTGVSQILYNENVQISSSNGVPIEIANSGKVQGNRYISTTIGCSNKWSIANVPSGIYFMDSHGKNIYMFNGQLNNLSTIGGFNTWCKNNIPEVGSSWTPDTFKDFVTYYDKKNQDILWINSEKALAYSEKLGAFTSFYDYGDTPYFSNFDDEGIWIRKDACLWQHQKGDYCKFFGTNKPYWMTLISNPEPQMDKIFTNLEFRAIVDGEGTDESTPYLPFNTLETWNEYQHGITTLSNRNGHSAFIHHSGSDSSLKRKFRIWRCDIPRDNAALALDEGLNIKRFKTHPIDRMRNPWLYLKLMKSTSGSNLRTEVHDIVMTYFD